jgi:VWFA-related protein
VPVSDSLASAPEINTRTTTVPLESRVNLVPVRVVVHDSAGRAVDNLHKEDFQIKQDGQLQFITHFSTEMAGSTDNQAARGEAIPLPTDAASTTVTGSAPDASGKPATAPAGALTMPTRFVALLFDDVHLDQGDLARTRIAAMRFIETTVKPNERLAIYTISGQHQVDFTDDRSAIRASITTLMASPVGAYDPKTQQDCLQMSYYQADLIETKGDQQAAAAALSDAVACEASLPGLNAQQQAAQASALVSSTAQMAIQAGYTNSQYAVRRLQEVVRRVSALPGQRSIVLVSPGFLMSTLEYEVSEIIDKANRANIFINTLDARGLYTVDPIGDVTRRSSPHLDNATMALDLQYRTEEQRVQSDVLSDLAYSTGGFYFRNNNDLDAGFRMTAAEPEVSYLLAFVPANLKNDGKFHALSVKLTTKEKYTVQARLFRAQTRRDAGAAGQAGHRGCFVLPGRAAERAHSAAPAVLQVGRAKREALGADTRGSEPRGLREIARAQLGRSDDCGRAFRSQRQFYHRRGKDSGIAIEGCDAAAAGPDRCYCKDQF